MNIRVGFILLVSLLAACEKTTISPYTASVSKDAWNEKAEPTCSVMAKDTNGDYVFIATTGKELTALISLPAEALEAASYVAREEAAGCRASQNAPGQCDNTNKRKSVYFKLDAKANDGPVRQVKVDATYDDKEPYLFISENSSRELFSEMSLGGVLHMRGEIEYNGVGTEVKTKRFQTEMSLLSFSGAAKAVKEQCPKLLKQPA